MLRMSSETASANGGLLSARPYDLFSQRGDSILGISPFLSMSQLVHFFRSVAEWWFVVVQVRARTTFTLCSTGMERW